jgi:hypothetical protein
MAAVEIRNLEILWIISSDETVGIHLNDLDCEGLNRTHVHKEINKYALVKHI